MIAVLLACFACFCFGVAFGAQIVLQRDGDKGYGVDPEKHGSPRCWWHRRLRRQRPKREVADKCKIPHDRHPHSSRTPAR